MMRLKVFHKTIYSYSEQVFLNPHHLYFTPLQRSYLRTVGHQLNISPTPEGQSLRVDAEGNQYVQAWWLNMTDTMEITLDAEVEVNAFNPYQFYVEPADNDNHPLLEVYRSNKAQTGKDLSDWTNQLRTENEIGLQLLLAIAEKIHKDWTYTSRHEIGILEVNQCFETKCGSCRDLTWLMMIVLRELGIAARFVSGYTFNPETGQDHELHAWVEAWLPGGGWIGVDPSLGLLADHSYIPIASSVDPIRTHPVQGIYAGSANSNMEYEVQIHQVD